MSDVWTREYVVEVKNAELIAGSPFSHPFREEIVRCRDCKCFIPSGYCGEMHHKALENGFCSWGERR